MTLIYKVNPKRIDEVVLRKVADMIRDGKLVAFPTETVYGLGTNAFNEEAVERLFVVKGREKKPVSVIISDFDVIHEIAKPNPIAVRLMERFFPGPITVIVKRRDVIPDVVTAGSDKVGIRMPNYRIPIEIARFSEVPIATPSANISGKPSPTRAEHVIQDLMGKIDAIVDGGETPLKIESTVIDTTTKPPRILRVGAIHVREIEEVTGKVEVLDYKAYKPSAKVVAVFKGDVDEVARRFKGKVCIVRRDEIENFLDFLRREFDVIVFECTDVDKSFESRIRCIADVIFD